MVKRIVSVILSIGILVFLAKNVFSQNVKSSAINQQKENTLKTKIVLLGTGTPNADPQHSGPAVAIIVDETPYIIDFGPGIIRRAAAAYQNGVKALKVSNIQTAFLTHLHSDHTAGYPDLIFTPWVLGRNKPLEVYGPPGIKEMTRHILLAYKKDIYIRINGLEHANNEGYKVNAHEIKPGVVFKDQNVTVKAFPVAHGSWDYAFGYRLETADRIIVISGDRAPKPSISEYCMGCDVLIHEVYSMAGFNKRSKRWQKYHSKFHTSSEELGKLAARVKPELLILYHQLLWGSTAEEILNEIHQIYDGKVVFGNDLDVY